MNLHISLRPITIAAMLAVALAVQGCGDDPAALVAAAKTAMEKRDFQTATIHIKNVLQEQPQNAQARLLFGQVLLAQGDAAGAEQELRKALEAGSDSEALFSLLVRAMYESGQAKKATDEFAGKALSSASAKAELGTALGRAFLAQGDTDHARERFESALASVQDFVPALYGLALVQLVQRNEAAVQELLDRALAKDPQAVEPTLLKADILAAAGKFDEAIALSAKVRDLKPPVGLAMQAQSRLISLYARQGQLDEASKELATLRQLAPKAPQTSLWEARIALLKKDPAKARDAIAQILRVAPDHLPSLIVAGIANMQLGDQSQAQTQLEQVVARAGELPGPRMLLAQSYLASRNATKALETLKPVLTSDSRDPSLLSLAGQAYLLAGDAKKSQEYFARQVSAEPQSALARTRLGVARLLAHDDVEAMQDLEAATKLDPASIQADTAIIAAYLRKGDVTKAVVAAKDLESKQPDNPLAANIKGGVMLAAKDISSARAAFERALQLQPVNLAAAAQLARLDVAERKPEVARKRFEDILAKDPKNISAYLLLAQLQAETGAPVATVKSVLERGVAADPTKPQARIALTRLLLSSGDTKAALEQAQQAQAASPNDGAALRVLGGVQLASNQAQQAVSTFSKLRNLEPANPANLLALAEAQERANEIGSAEESLRKAIQMKSDFMPAHERLVALLAREKRVDEALKVARDLASAKPEAIVGYVLEAQALGAGQRWPEATQAWQKVVQKFKVPQAVLGVYGALSAQKKNEEANKAALDWIKNNPKDTVVRGFLGERAIAAKDYRGALTHYNALLALAPNSPLVLNNLAWTMHQLKDPGALARAEAAAKLAPKAPAVLDTLGVILLDQGQTQRSVATLKQAVELAPKSAALHLNYARALVAAGDTNGAKRESALAAELAPQGSPLREQAARISKQ